MPRPLVYSNGSLFLGLDERFRIRDLFFPQVGLYNHLSGHAIRMGVWVDGAFSWVDEDGWNRNLAYEPGNLVGRVELTHPAFGLEISCRDSMHSSEDRFRRELEVRSTYGRNRDIRLFFTHDLRIAETDIGDTAFYSPFLEGMVHYKGPHWFLFKAKSEGRGITEYATGLKGFGGFEGTWRDAEDGRLSMNPISQGSVDSTMSLHLELQEDGRANAVYEIVAADSLADLESDRQILHEIHEISMLDGRLHGLPESVIELCKRSLHVVLAHCDARGAILAATDSDIMATNRANYAYCWPRDGAHVCMVLDRLGLHEPTRRFFRFCERAITLDHPVLLQKYRPDGTLGATWHPWIVDGKAEVPFQEDESASVLQALGKHFHHTQDQALLEEVFPTLVVPMANFIAAYRNLQTGLPLPSYDLWEERRGVHLYTSATVFAGLRAAAEMAGMLDDPRAFDYREAASEVRRGILEILLIQPQGHFARTLKPDGTPDLTPDASALFLAECGVLEPEDPLFQNLIDRLTDNLWLRTEVGGLARYKDDYYFRISNDLPGNPWIICTLWLAQAQVSRAKTIEDLQPPLRMLEWAARHSGTTQILPEQLHPYTGEHLSVSPLTWSHSEVLKTALDWVEKRGAL